MDAIIKTARLLTQHPILLVPSIIFIIMTFIISFIFLQVNNLLGPFLAIITNPKIITQAMQSMFNDQTNIITFMVSIAIFIFTQVAVGVSLTATKYTLIKKVLDKKKPQLWKSFIEGHKYIIRIIWIKVILLSFVLLTIVITATLTKNIPLIIGVTTFTWLVCDFLLIFRYPHLFIKNKDTIHTLINTGYITIKKTKYTLKTYAIALLIPLIIGIIFESGLSVFPKVTHDMTSMMFLMLLGLYFLRTLGGIIIEVWRDVFVFYSYEQRNK